MAFLPALSQEKTPQGIEAVNPDRALKCRRGGVPRALGTERPGTGSLRKEVSDTFRLQALEVAGARG